MSIADRTNPRRRIPRKLGTNPTNTGTGLDGSGSFADRQNWTPPTGTQPFPTPTPLPVPAPTPVPGTPTAPTPVPRPNPRPLPPNMGIPGGPGGLQPAPLPVPGANPPGTPLPLYPEPPAPGQPIPPGYGLDFVRQPTPNEMVANQLDTLLRSDSPYIRNAEQRGAEYAASRGNLNSSIGAGAARRAAIEAATPIAQADAQVYRDANAANFDSLAQLRQMRTAGDIENWLNDSNFNREYNGRLAMMPIQSSMDMMAFIAQRAAEDPAVWTPDVMSGWMNFFNMWQGDLFSSLLGDAVPGGG